MKTYLYLQCKRTLRFFPFVAIVSVALLLSLAVVLNNAVFLDNSSEEKQRFRIAIVGNTDDTYLDLAMNAAETFDSSRFTVEFNRTDEEDARNLLYKGQISAYVVVPDGFIQSALRGNLKTIKYVTTSGNSELSAIFKDELTSVISGILEESQKGVYGLANALRANEQYDTVSDHMNSFSIEYLTFILERNNLFHVNELGVSDNVTLPEYLLCGLSVLFLLLMALPYAPVFIKKDYSLNKKLLIRGQNNCKQVTAEFISYLIVNLLLIATLVLILSFTGNIMDGFTSKFIPSLSDTPSIIIHIFPVVLAFSSLAFLFFELSENIVNGVILYFFSTIALCYISGCLYPIYTFPQVIQDISVFLPTGIARIHFANCITETPSSTVLWLLLYSAIFFTISLVLRKYKTTGRCDG